MFFLHFWLEDGRNRIRILVAQKHPYPDPQHCSKGVTFMNMRLVFSLQVLLFLLVTISNCLFSFWRFPVLWQSYFPAAGLFGQSGRKILPRVDITVDVFIVLQFWFSSYLLYHWIEELCLMSFSWICFSDCENSVIGKTSVVPKLILR
jgi:hypothetical protein